MPNPILRNNNSFISRRMNNEHARSKYQELQEQVSFDDENSYFFRIQGDKTEV